MPAGVPCACRLIQVHAVIWSESGSKRWEVDMLAPITHILPLTTIVRKRLLPVDGRVIAKPGQKVTPTDVVAEAVVGRKHMIVDVAKLLRVSQRSAMAYIKVKKGQKVNKGEIIAESTGLFGREAHCPSEGRVVAIGGGKLVLESGGSNLELIAGIPGIVSETIGDRGVIIRATGSIVQGMWGNGRLDTGVMISG